MRTDSEKNDVIDGLEKKLDSPDAAVRARVLRELCKMAEADGNLFPEQRPVSNMHAHTFFSYNCYGYSPSRFAWLARRAGLECAGIVDFDVLDGLDEFLCAGRMAGIKAAVGLESRVFVPEFAHRVINSPGEPGISYHMGAGLTSTQLGADATEFLKHMRSSASDRNREIVKRVNAFLKRIELDYDRDIVPLTPSGNATERHICLAYALKAASALRDTNDLRDFWSEKLGEVVEQSDLPMGPKLQNLIRAKMMKQGGPGYVPPGKGSFPKMAAMKKFVLEAGGIPTITVLDGASDGEQAIEELFDTAAATGAAALNIVPDRNFKPFVKDKKLENLYAVVKLANERHFPVIVGTEMNSPGQKFVDSFEAPELAALAPTFIRGARILYAHTVLQSRGQMGYLSKWASIHFAGSTSKNEIFEEIGRCLLPSDKGDSDPGSEVIQFNRIMSDLADKRIRSR